MAQQTNDIVLELPILKETNVPHGLARPGTQSPEQRSPEPETDLKHYLNLHEAAVEGDWNAAKKFFDCDPNSLTATISLEGMTVLHVAARSAPSEFVEKLVELLPADELAKHDVGYRRTALHYIAAVGKVSAAQKMVMKNPKLPQEVDIEGHTPIFAAVIEGCLPDSRKEMVKFLAEETKDEFPSFAFTGEHSGQLIVGIVANGFYDIALKLITRYSNLALARDKNGESILQAIAKNRSAFQRGSKLGFWKRLLYPRASTNIEQQDLLELLQTISHTFRMKDISFSPVYALYSAAKNDCVEVFHEIWKFFPDSLWIEKEDEGRLLHVAIVHRSHKVFNYLVKLDLRAFCRFFDKQTGDNILHRAARLAPDTQLRSVSGTAFQMQRELQWFKEVEKRLPSARRWETNREKKTPYQVFIEEHTKLHEEAEKWMKETSRSCMVVATLVATVVFPAMITIPEGIHGNTGIPISLQQLFFLVFTISNGLAVFSSMISLLMFLSILTSRYAEEDFLTSLPLKLIGGLSFLLIAIATMTIAFAAALQIAVHSKFISSYIVLIFLGCIPLILFLMLHLPLFREVLTSTWGAGIFKQSHRKHS